MKMGLNDNVVQVSRRVLPIFFVIDTSGSMTGNKISAVNAAIEEGIPFIQELASMAYESFYTQIKIAAIEFFSGTRWITSDGPVEADQFRWNHLNAGGVADFGAACKTLNEKLSRKAFMNEATGSYAPVILLLSNGNYTDDWERPLAELKNNNWFKTAIKAAIAVGEDSNIDLLAEFTGSMDAVIELQPNIVHLLIKEAINSKNHGAHSSDFYEENKDYVQTLFNRRIKNFQDCKKEDDW